MKSNRPPIFTNPHMLDAVALDWDDTINATFIPLRKAVVDAGYPVPTPDVYLTTENTNGGLDVALASGEFMRVRESRYGDLYLTQAILKLQQAGVAVGICTHRGFHENASELSEEAFATLGWKPNFIIILDPANQPDKVAVLTERFGENFVLVDDRPRWDAKHALPKNVWLMDQPWNRDVPVADPYCRVVDLVDLGGKLVTVMGDFVNPAYVYGVTDNWTQDDELRLAKWLNILDGSIESQLESYKKKLKSQNMTAHMAASVYETQSAKHLVPSEGQRVATHHIEGVLLRILNHLHISPISVNDSGEWSPINGGVELGDANWDAEFEDVDFSIRQTDVYRRRAIIGLDEIATETMLKVFGAQEYEIGVDTTILKPNPYGTGWVAVRTVIKWRKRDESVLYQQPLIPPVVYQSYSDDTIEFTSIDEAVEECRKVRSGLYVKLIETQSDPVTGEPLPEQLLDIAKAVDGGVQNAGLFQLIALWQDMRDECGTWDSLYRLMEVRHYGGWLEIKRHVKPDSTSPKKVVRVVDSIELQPNVFLVNTERGHNAVLAEWCNARWLEPRTVAAHEMVYPAVITLVPLGNKSYSAVLVPLSQITQAISVVGLN